MFLMGSDFQYENADGWYKNLDKIIHHVNADGRVNTFYSTPEEYTAAKLAENITWPVKTDDFMPLANDEHSYWTGFYSSRPALKRYERQLAGFLQAARQVQLLANMPVNGFVTAALALRPRPWFGFWSGFDRHDMDPLAAAVALCQHHDAVSGTEMQHVAYDYAARLAAGAAVADAATVAALRLLAGAPPTTSLTICRLLNETVCEASVAASRESRAFTVLVYNPLSVSRDSLPVRVPVFSKGGEAGGGDEFRVSRMPAGEEVVSAVVPATGLASAEQTLQHSDGAAWELLFLASVPAFALQAFRVDVVSGPGAPGAAGAGQGGTATRKGTRKQKQNRRRRRRAAGAPPPQPVVISNEFLSVAFDASSGRMASMTNLEHGVTIEIDQTLHWYEAAQAGAGGKLCGDGQQKSGAYIFRPNNTAADGGDAACVNADCRATLRVLKSQLVSEVEQVFSPWATQTVRLYSGARHVEVEWTIGPVPIQDGKGKEVVSRYRTSISSAGSFLTDSNGREMLRRTRCDPREGAVDLTCRGSVRDVCLRCMMRACCCVR